MYKAEEIELYVYDKFIKEMVVEENGKKKISKEYLDNLKLAPHEKNFILYILNKKKIKVIEEKITREERSPFVRDNNYGDIQANELEKIDESVMSKVEYSSANDKVYEDFKELDEYLETRFIPAYVLLKQRKTEDGKVEQFPSIRLHHITALKLSEVEFNHVMNYLNEKNIKVGGKSSALTGEFSNYDYVTTYKESSLPLSVPTHVTLEKIKAYKENKDSKLREEIITDNLRLVPYVAYRYAMATKIDQHELEGYGYEGLILALENFDVSYGCAFSTYAIAYIRGNILDGIQEILNGKRDNFYYDYVNAKLAVERESGMKLSESPELIDDVIDLLVATGRINEKNKEYAKRKIISMVIGNASYDDEELVEELYDDGQLVYEHDFDELVLNSDIKEKLEELLKTLTSREAKVLRLRFGFDDGKPKTLEEVGKIFGVTKERIRQIEAKACRKMRHPSRSKFIRDYHYNSGGDITRNNNNFRVNDRVLFGFDYDKIISNTVILTEILNKLPFAYGKLNPYELEILTMRIPGDDGQYKTLEEVSKIVGWSPKFVLHVEENALRKLRGSSKRDNTNELGNNNNSQSNGHIRK